VAALLTDRVVLVTGAGAGIGRGVVEACRAAGARVLVGTLEQNASFEDPGVECETVDVGDPEAIERWVRRAHRHHGRIDGLVANAGITVQVPFLDATLDDLERLWRINQRGAYLCAQAVARRMVADRRPGAIVAIASNHARASDAGYEMYAATKAAIVAMCRAMAWSLGDHGIRVNSLSPGLTSTETVSGVAADPALEAVFKAWHATGRYNTVREVGECAAFLLSDASSSISGADLLADQGMSARLANFP